MSRRRLRGINQIHNDFLTESFGAVDARAVQRNLDATVAFGNRRPVPIVSGRWDDGSAQRRLLEVLVDLGLIQDETEKGDLSETGGYGAVPGITALAAAGTTASVSIAGTDTSGQINLTPGGASIAAGAIVTVTFAVERATSEYDVFVSLVSNAARSLPTGIGPVSRGTTSFNLDTRTTLTSGSVYQFSYLVVEREY
jgi:hypothetical protein